MAALDLGDLGFTIKVDTGDFDSKIGQVERKARQLDQSLEKAGSKKIKPAVDSSGLDKVSDAASKASSDLDKVNSKKVSPKSDPAPLERTSKAAGDASSNIDRAAASADRASASFSNAGSSTDGFASKLRGTVGKLGGFAAGIAGVAGAAQVMQNGFDKVTSIEDTTKALGVMMGSADKASGFMDKLVESNMKSTYSFDAWAEAGKTLVAFGVDAEQANESVTALGEAAAATGKGEEALLSMSDAFGQAAASGKISMDTINRLSAGGVQGLTILANEFGVTTEEMQDMISKGAVPAQEGIKALTDGIINGSEGAAGKVEALSGVMGEMATTTSGTLKNMGAEFNNTAAAIFEKLSPMIKAGADKLRVGAQNLTKWIKDVDVSPLVSMGEAIMNLPGPVKDLTKAFVALKVAQAALNTEAGKSTVSRLSSSFASGRKGVVDFTTSLGEAYVYMRKANPEMSRAGAAMRVLGGKGGVAAAGMSKLKSAGMGLMNMFGGPWGLAFMGAATVVTSVTSAAQKAKAVQSAYSEATKEAAAAQAELNASLAGTSTALSSSQLENAAKMVEAQTVGMRKMAEEYSGFNFTIVAPDMEWHKQSMFNSEWREYKNTVLEAKGAYEAIDKAATELNIPMSDLNRVVAEGGPQFESLMQTLRKGGDDSQVAAEKLQGIRDSIEESIEAARQLDPAAAQAAAGIDILADASSSAEDKLSALKSVMQAMGLISQTAMEANMEAAEKIDEVASKMEGLANAELGIGGALFNGEELDYTNENAQALSKTLSELSDELMGVAVANGDVAGIWELMGPQLSSLREEMGLAGEEFDAVWSGLLESYGLVPEVVTTLVELDGASEAVQSLGDVWAALYPLEEGAKINIDPPEPAVLDVMDELGIKYQEIKNDAGEVIQYKVTAPSEEVMAQVDEITAKMAEIDDETVKIETIMDTTPIEVGVDNAKALIEQLDIEAPSPRAQLIIDDLLANGSIAKGDLEYLNQMSANPSANLEKSLLDAGVKDAHSQLQGVDDHNTVSVMDGDSSGVRREAQSAKNSINGVPNRKETTFVARLAGAWDAVRGFFGTNVSRAPRRADGGTIPGFAAGGNPGYRLPGTGPGTETTDGFLGVTAAGMPLARLDANEWVINARSANRFDRTLAGINAGNTHAILAGLARELPGLETGGRTKSDEVKEALAPFNNGPYVMGGFSPSSFDCSGAVSAGVNTYLGLDPFDSRMSTVTIGSWLAAKGFENGRGNGSELVVGWYDYGGGANGHTAMMLPDGTFIESGGNTGQGMTIGGAAGPLDGRGFTNFMYLPGSGDDEAGLTGDGGVTINGNGTDLSISDFGGASGGGAKRASHKAVSAPTTGQMFNAPGLASNTPGGTIGGSLSGAHKAQAYAYGQQAGLNKAQIDQAMNFANPFIGQQSFRDELGEPATKQILGIAKQLEGAIGRGGIAAQVESALNAKTPNWDVWLRVNDETIEAFNALGEAQADRKNASLEITEAEEKLAELHKKSTKSDEESTEKLAEAYKNLDKAKGKELTKSYTADKKAEDIEKAEKKIRDLKEKTSENEVKAAQQIAEAEQDLVDAREEEKRAIREVEQAQLQYNTALTMAPIKAVASLTDTIAAGLGRMAENMQLMAENMDNANRLFDVQHESQLADLNSKRSLQDAARRMRELERENSDARHGEILAQQQAEYDLALARHDYATEHADREINLAQLRTQGILDVSQKATDTDRLAILSASAVQVAEKQLEVSRASAARGEYEREIALQEARFELNYQEELAKIQHERLAVATQELADAAAAAAGRLGGSASALAKETEGKQKKASGAAKVIGGLASIAGAVAMTVATGGAALPAAIGLGASGLAGAVSGGKEIAEGKAQEKVYKKEAKKEYDALSKDDKRRVDAARSGMWLGVLAGGAVGMAGGDSKSVGDVFDATSGLFSLPMYQKEMEAKYGVEAAALLTQKKKMELDRRERQAELNKLRSGLELAESTSPELDKLAEMQQTLQQQLAEMEQENKQLAGVNDKLDRGNKSVLMSIGGSGWGQDLEAGMRMAASSGGFGGVTRDEVGEWSSLNVEDGWRSLNKVRALVDTAADTAADAAASRSMIEGLPETVVGGRYARQLADGVVEGAQRAAQRSAEAGMEATRRRAYEDAAQAVLAQLGGGDTTNVETQFTGAVTVNAKLEDKVLSGLSSMVKNR